MFFPDVDCQEHVVIFQCVLLVMITGCAAVVVSRRLLLGWMKTPIWS